MRRTSSIRTVCRCHFYKLSKEDFDEVLQGFPELRERITSKAMQRLNKTMKVRSRTVGASSIAERPGGESCRATACASSASSEASQALQVHARFNMLRQQSSPAMFAQDACGSTSTATAGEGAFTNDRIDSSVSLRVRANGIAQSRQQWERKFAAVEDCTTAPPRPERLSPIAGASAGERERSRRRSLSE